MTDADRRFTRVATTVAVVGAVTSGPLGYGLLAVTHPQPPWRDVTTWAAKYHDVQALPFVFGFLLVGGSVAMVAGLSRSEAIRGARGVAAVAFVAIFGAMVFVNYALQIMAVPALLRGGDASGVAFAGQLTMANPRSVGWALEMWGYALLGVATWLVAPAVSVLPRGTFAARLFVVNGPISVLSAIVAAWSPGGLTGPFGLTAFAVWNALVIVMFWALMRSLGTSSPEHDVPQTAEGGLKQG
jgi:hypothetical protein